MYTLGCTYNGWTPLDAAISATVMTPPATGSRAHTSGRRKLDS